MLALLFEDSYLIKLTIAQDLPTQCWRFVNKLPKQSNQVVAFKSYSVSDGVFTCDQQAVIGSVGVGQLDREFRLPPSPLSSVAVPASIVDTVGGRS